MVFDGTAVLEANSYLVGNINIKFEIPWSILKLWYFRVWKTWLRTLVFFCFIHSSFVLLSPSGLFKPCVPHPPRRCHLSPCAIEISWHYHSALPWPTLPLRMLPQPLLLATRHLNSCVVELPPLSVSSIALTLCHRSPWRRSSRDGNGYRLPVYLRAQTL